MMLIRPVSPDDLADILALAVKGGSGLTTLPNNQDKLQARINRSVDTFAGKLSPAQQGYLFVLEDTQEQKVVGVCAIETAVGLEEPWYNFRQQKMVHASKELNVYKSLDTLYLSNDLTGLSELCTLFLDPDYQRDKNGTLLSKARFLFIANFSERFSARIFAEMRGVSDEQGESPFWDSLGKHFFDMSFPKADYISGTGNKTFIAELMPTHPIYVSLLPPAAQAVIGVVHRNTAPARAILESEGFSYRGYMDIFDAGPVLEAEISQIRAVKQSQLVTLGIGDAQPETRDDLIPYLVSNQQLADFRVLLCYGRSPESLVLSQKQATALQVTAQDAVRVVSLFPQ